MSQYPPPQQNQYSPPHWPGQSPQQSPWPEQPAQQSWPGQPTQQSPWPGQSPQQPSWPGQPTQQPSWPGQSPQLQSNTGYRQPFGPQWPPQQQPMQPGGYPPQLPKKKSRRRIWIIVGVLATVMLLSLVGIAAIMANTGKTSVDTTLTPIVTGPQTSAATTSSTAAATTTAISSTSGGTWTTTHTFTGSGTKKTATFTVGNDWKITYSCSGMARIAENGFLGVAVYDADGSIANPAAINATCKFSSAITNGETEEHQGGQVYLSISGTGNWTVTVQELK